MIHDKICRPMNCSMFIYILLALKQIVKKDRVLLELSAQVLKLPIFIQSSTS